MAENKNKKRLRIERGKVINSKLPKTTVKDFGFSELISKIDRAIEIIDRRR